MLSRLLRSLTGRGERRTTTDNAVATEMPAVVTAPTAPVEPPTATTESTAFEMPGLPFQLRPLLRADLPQLANVYRAAVNELASRDYDADQRRVWQAQANDAAFIERLAEGVTIVAEHHGTPVAFAQLCPANHLRMMYVDPEWAGLGIATLLYQYLEDEARILGSRELTTDASHTAKRFFESVGFKALEEEAVVLEGVSLARTKMEKKL